VLRRIAGNCFWLGRYLERAEYGARLVLAAEAHAGLDSDATWRLALELSAQAMLYRDAFGQPRADAAASFLIADRANPSSVAQCLRAAGANARSARDLLGDAVWEAVNRAWIEADALDAVDVAGKGPAEIGAWALARCRTVRGAAAELAHEPPSHSLQAGAALERCDALLGLLVELGSSEATGADRPPIGTQLHARMGFLAAAAGVEDDFRRLYHGQGGETDLATYLAGSPSHPRALPLTLGLLLRTLRSLFGERAPIAALEAMLDGALRRAGDAAAAATPVVLRTARATLAGLASGLERDHFGEAAPPPMSSRASEG
jgi:uncharacterized alpha-E superfamily protein